MSNAVDSKTAQAYLIDPMSAPEPFAETGPGTHFTSTFAPAKPSTPTSSNNPYRQDSALNSPDRKSKANGLTATKSPVRKSSPKERFPNYREEAFASYDDGSHRRSIEKTQSPPRHNAAKSTSTSGNRHRRTSSLKERFPGDTSVEPLNILRRDSRKADRAPHLNKRGMPGPDMVDRLDPAVGGKAYHHEGPYDATLMSRNSNKKYSPVAALETSNLETLRATPQENVKDSLDRHKPLDGVATVPPGVEDRFGRTYHYNESDLMQEAVSDAGYKRWPGKDYDPEDRKGKGDTFALDRALQAHKIDENGIEMEDRARLNESYHEAKRRGTLDKRDPVEIAGGEAAYAALQQANSGTSETVRRTGSIKAVGEGLKKRIGSLRHKKDD
ncbi:Hypothetical protein R9X50_00454100 [Acrodontium crateriforme]|uniref:Uncharacterized protein n=1 Tax=Acrodontium crateriforme TaxID=150365 RepID=A0AAQ3M5J5_9PEZI|nr:Hypothetical protein R9X50_00454100 [Acrodontium crateriforme]